MPWVLLHEDSKKGIHYPLSYTAAEHFYESLAWRSRERDVTSNLLGSELPATQVPGCATQPYSEVLSWKVACEYSGETEGVWSTSLSYSARHSAESQRKKPDFCWLESSPDAPLRKCDAWGEGALQRCDLNDNHFLDYSLTFTTKKFPCQQSKWKLSFIVSQIMNAMCQILKSIFSWKFPYTLVFPSVLDFIY